MPNSTNLEIQELANQLRRQHRTHPYLGATPFQSNMFYTEESTVPTSNESSTVGHRFDMLSFLGDPSPELVNDSFVGVEIEVEGLRSLSPTFRESLSPFWNVVEDGSLRNGGRELVFSAPLRGTDVVTALHQAENELTLAGAVTSNRCSVHVHLDVRDMSMEQLRGLIYLYVLLEDAFFQVAGAHRKDNIYSLPISQSEDYLNRVSYFLSRPSFEGYCEIRTDDKYSAFNLASISRQGSIEFRHHEGTFEYNKLIRWINLILSLKNAAISGITLNANLVQNMLDTGKLIPYLKQFFSTDQLKYFLIDESINMGSRSLKYLISYEQGTTLNSVPNHYKCGLVLAKVSKWNKRISNSLIYELLIMGKILSEELEENGFNLAQINKLREGEV